MSNTTILGAGVTGLAASFALQHKTNILEASEEWGGLCGSFSIDGFRFDNAVHFSFADNFEVRNIFDRVPHIAHTPDPINYSEGIWVKHPVQNNLFALPIEERIKCLCSFFERPTQNKIENYKDWLLCQYGEYISNKFPERYTRKYWRCNADELSIDWVGNRMYRPSPEEVLRGAMTNETEMVYYAKEMRYPQNGGYKNFLTPLAEQAPIRYEKKVILIDTKNKCLEMSDGKTHNYEALISTLPLVDMVKMLKDVPSWLHDCVQKLAYTQVVIVSMGFKRPDVMKNLWWYIYDEDIHSPRVHSPGLKSPANVPMEHGSLQFEYHVHSHREKILPNDAYIENTLYGLKKMDIAGENEPLFIDVRTLPFGNVIFTHETTETVKKIREYFKSCKIVTAGRFGEWGYLWSHQAFMSGWKAATTLL